MKNQFRTQIRVTEELGYLLKKKAKENMRSLNNEITVRLLKTLEDEKAIDKKAA